MRPRDFLKKYVLIIPISILVFWALFALIQVNFYLDTSTMGSDFTYFYNAAIKIIQNPSMLYIDEGKSFYNLPAFAYFFIIFTIFPFRVAHFVLFFSNIILGILFILELNKIMKLIGMNHDFLRIVFISIIIFSWNIYFQFYYPQVKFIVGLIMLFIIRREIEWKKKSLEKDMKYYLLNYFLMIFSLSMAPYFIFIYLILIVDDIGIKNLLKKKGLTHFFLLIIIFLLQNITLFIYPNLIIEFLEKGINFNRGTSSYLRDIWASIDLNINITLIFLIPLIIGNLFICFSKFDLPTKLGLSGLCFLIWSTYGSDEEFISECLLLILFAKYMIMEKSIIKTILKNKFLVIGLAALLFLNIMNTFDFTFYKWFPFLIGFEWIVNIRMLIPIIIILLSFIITSINMKKNNIPPNNLLIN